MHVHKDEKLSCWRGNLDPNNEDEEEYKSLIRTVREGMGKHATVVIEIDCPDFWVGFWAGFAICLVPGAALLLWILAQ